MISNEHIKDLQARVQTLGRCINIDSKRADVEQRQERTLAADFWDDPKEAEKFLKELSGVKFWVTGFDSVASGAEDLNVLYDFAKDSLSGAGDDAQTPEVEELEQAYAAVLEELEALELRNMLGEEGDNLGAVLTINSGAGGTEANDWSAMLMRMYIRWAERNGYKVTVTDELEGEDAGIKSVTMQVEGDYAFGYLKAESGVHRLVRISPFNAAGKRQTSFVSCDVMPDIEEDIDIEVKDEDIRIDTYRSSGAGGQHINKTSSAIRITHFPTGIVVQCQNERSQFQNKDKAMQMLKAKLYLLKQEEQMAKAAGIRGEVTEIGWGNQIRSYVMQPYTMVKDHRTGCESGNVDAVMDGALDSFINAYLKWKSVGGKPVEEV